MDVMFKLKLFFLKLKERVLKTGSKWDLLAPEEDTAILFAHQHINDEPEKMLDEHHYSPEYVLAHYGAKINYRFRAIQANEDDINIQKRISLNSADCNLVLYRGVGKEVFHMMHENAKPFPDGDLLEKSFLQCSLVKGRESSGTFKLRIYVAKGTPLIYLGNVNDEQFFYEVDIQSGALLKIISADSTYLNCQLLQTD